MADRYTYNGAATPWNSEASEVRVGRFVRLAAGQPVGYMNGVGTEVPIEWSPERGEWITSRPCEAWLVDDEEWYEKYHDGLVARPTVCRAIVVPALPSPEREGQVSVTGSVFTGQYLWRSEAAAEGMVWRPIARFQR